jgi:hypothetical protein
VKKCLIYVPVVAIAVAAVSTFSAGTAVSIEPVTVTSEVAANTTTTPTTQLGVDRSDWEYTGQVPRPVTNGSRYRPRV